MSHSEQRLIVAVRWGPLAGYKAIINPGQRLTIGRTETAQLVIPDDSQMSDPHFEFSWDGSTCRLRDLGSQRGTWLGGQLVTEGEVNNHGWVRAGSTDFSVYFEGETPPPLREPDLTPPEELLRNALQKLTQTSDSLYSVLDAARDERLLVLIRESVEECHSLYEGLSGQVLAEVAPYLVSLPPGSRLLEILLREGWGRHWGLFLTSSLAFKEVRRHLRKFLMVKDLRERELYFRFYDPRVLRLMLPAFRPEQLRLFFEGLGAVMMEGSERSTLVRWSLPPLAGLRQETLPLL